MKVLHKQTTCTPEARIAPNIFQIRDHVVVVFTDSNVLPISFIHFYRLCNITWDVTNTVAPSIFLALNFCSLTDYQKLWHNCSLFVKTSFDPN